MSEVKCPYCGTLSSKVHSSYEREIQDLPMQNRKVILLVKTRKMFCSNCKCEMIPDMNTVNTAIEKMDEIEAGN